MRSLRSPGLQPGEYVTAAILRHSGIGMVLDFYVKVKHEEVSGAMKKLQTALWHSPVAALRSKTSTSLDSSMDPTSL